LVGTIAPSPVQPLDSDISRGINKLQRRNQIYEMLPKIDCAACGSPTCMTFAACVVKGDATAEECVFISMKRFESLSKNLWETVEQHNKRIRTNPERRDHEA